MPHETTNKRSIAAGNRVVIIILRIAFGNDPVLRKQSREKNPEPVLKSATEPKASANSYKLLPGIVYRKHTNR